MKQVLLQAGLVLVLGSSLALVANGVSPRGLSLGRNYFPGLPLSATPTTPPATTPAPAADPHSEAAVVQRLRQKGLQGISHEQVVAVFRSPEVAAQKTMLVDARNDEHYLAGHIPGAWQFDHYHPEQHITTVLPFALVADKVIVYCTGGDCEDSEFAAVTLMQAGVAQEKLQIYAGGITQWQQAGEPIEVGVRGSGQLRPAGR